MYTLQALTPRDLPTLYKLAERIWLPTFAPLFTESELQALYKGMYNDELLTNWMAQEGCTLYFICRKGEDSHQAPERLLGYMATEIKSDHLKLDKIYVDPGLQGKGIGQWCMARVVEMALQHELLKVSLRVNRGNRQAISFYLKWGFEIEAEINFPAPNGYVYEDYIMTFNISQARP